MPLSQPKVITIVFLCSVSIISILILISDRRRDTPQVRINPVSMFEVEVETSFDITFHSIPCGSLRICVMDATGKREVHGSIDNNDIRKTRLDLIRRRLSGCGKVVSLEQWYVQVCFYTTVETLHAIPSKIGNFHVALGRVRNLYTSDGKHMHYLRIEDILRFNASHTIHHLSFGKAFLGQSFPLNGHTVKEKASGIFTYHLTITPVEITSSWGSKIHSYTYGYKYKYKHVTTSEALPGVFFVYKIESGNI